MASTDPGGLDSTARMILRYRARGFTFRLVGDKVECEYPIRTSADELDFLANMKWAIVEFLETELVQEADTAPGTDPIVQTWEELAGLRWEVDDSPGIVIEKPSRERLMEVLNLLSGGTGDANEGGISGPTPPEQERLEAERARLRPLFMGKAS